MPVSGTRKRTKIALKKGEGLVATAAAMLGVLDRTVVNLINDGKLIARRHLVDQNRTQGQWIVDLASVREYARITNRVIREPEGDEVLTARHRELSSYVTKEFGDALAAAGISIIDGSKSALGWVWITFLGPTGRKNLTKFEREEGKAKPLLGKKKFRIEFGEDGLAHVHYKAQSDENATGLRSAFKAIIQKAVETVDEQNKKLSKRRKVAQ